MELNELESIWREENKRLESRIRVDEQQLIKLKLDNAVSNFDSLVSMSVWGRNLALVYCIISLVMSYSVLTEWAYSIPGILGGLAMLLSFIHHLSIKKPKYYELSIMDLQKHICMFRIHTLTSNKYDFLVVCLWTITLLPLYIRASWQTDIYSNVYYFKGFVVACLGCILLTVILSRSIYKDYIKKFKQAESNLADILALENHK